jgi:predicted metal-dependent peptidase
MSTLQEMAVAIDELQPTNGTCVLFTNHECVDENVHDVFSGGELLDLEVPMGGGTYLSTALDWMEEHGVQPDLTIAFTDGYINDDDVETLVENDVVIVLDRVPHYGTRRMLEKAGARYLVAVDEVKAA